MDIREINLETNEVIERPYTAEEKKHREAVKAQLADTVVALQAAAAKKAAILAALADATGYTADELREALNA